jgi:cytochrome c-type biogenesis protein CcmH/NrfG
MLAGVLRSDFLTHRSLLHRRCDITMLQSFVIQAAGNNVSEVVSACSLQLVHACSQRELARTSLAGTQYERAAEHFTLALSRNPLDAESWFGLGFCELKRGADRAGHAALAFTRCVQADASHGEAWNNLGALHVAAERYGPAFKALSVSIKLCQRSWQVCA